MGVRVIAASADDEAGAREMISEQELTFPVAYGVSVDQIDQLEKQIQLNNQRIKEAKVKNIEA